MVEPSVPRRAPIDAVVCDGRDFSAADLATIEALARLGLGARRAGARLRVDDAPAPLVELVELCGLGDVIRCGERGHEP